MKEHVERTLIDHRANRAVGLVEAEAARRRRMHEAAERRTREGREWPELDEDWQEPEDSWDTDDQEE